MKSRIFESLIAITILIAVVLPSPARAAATRINFPGSEDCPNPPLWTRAWEAGPNLHLAGITATCYDTADTPNSRGPTIFWVPR